MKLKENRKILADGKMHVQSLLFKRMSGLHGLSYAHLRKIINIKKIVRLTTRNQLYAISGRIQAKVDIVWEQSSLFT